MALSSQEERILAFIDPVEGEPRKPLLNWYNAMRDRGYFDVE